MYPGNNHKKLMEIVTMETKIFHVLFIMYCMSYRNI